LREKAIEKTILISMIIVKFQSGALGNFLCAVLHEKIKPFAVLEYGKPISKNKILHTGGYESIEDARFKEDTSPIRRRIISHNNPKFETWVNKIRDSKNIFIDLKSNFVEYRLNYINKMPDWNNKLNQYATEDSWKDFKHPIANDDARRIVRLHQNKEQMIKVDQARDIIFDFKNFYITDEELWIDTFKKLAEQVEIEVANDELSSWFKHFRKGQAGILERAKVLYNCIDKRKFVPGLTENEKGIIIGYSAVADESDCAEYFIDAYKRHS
jgi:hypothetical protein